MIKSDFLNQRLVKAIKFIDANLENKLSLDEICKHAGLSKFHFHRLFLAFFDMNIYEYMKAQKLKEAANRLAVSYTHLDVYKRQPVSICIFALISFILVSMKRP